MGGCFSKKTCSSSPSSATPPPLPSTQKLQQQKKTRKESPQQKQQPSVEAHKKIVFAISQSKNPPPPQSIPTEEKETKEEDKPAAEKRPELPKKGPAGEEDARVVPVRTSSCTKEEVDAILIQCGRLSRSSSGKTSNDPGGRKYSGSKRSYDFDNERKDEEDWEEKPQSRPSPRRRANSRERDGGDGKRSGSRERGGGGGGGRRVSRSPGRRSDGPSASSSSSADKSRVPAKMVSVPAREKGNAAAEAGGISAKRAPSAVVNRRGGGDVGGMRSASPRSRSPANPARVSNENAHHNHPPPPPLPQQPQSLSRSSSRKTDHSPYRRNPMSEIDENSLRAEQPLPRNQTHSSNNNSHQKLKKTEGDEIAKKPSQIQSQKVNEATVQLRKSEVEQANGSNSNIKVNKGVRQQLMSCRAVEQVSEIVEEAFETQGPLKGLEVPLGLGADILNPRTITRTRSSRRSSRDVDMNLAFNPDNLLNQSSYASLLLEDIQNYHQQKAAVSLPACVSKACSILEAVADLNSSFSDNKRSEAGHVSSHHGRFSKMGLAKAPFVESEVVVKDDLMEPSIHKYVSVRDVGRETEPQESAGSNSFIGGQTWAASSWEPNSTDSTDSNWNSQSNDSEEVEKQEFGSLGSQHRRSLSDACDLDSKGRRLRSTSTNNSGSSAATGLTVKKKEFDQNQPRRGGIGKGGVGRAAAASS